MRDLVYKFEDSDGKVFYIKTYAEYLKFKEPAKERGIKYLGIELIETKNPKDKEL